MNNKNYSILMKYIKNYQNNIVNKQKNSNFDITKDTKKLIDLIQAGQYSNSETLRNEMLDFLSNNDTKNDDFTKKISDVLNLVRKGEIEKSLIQLEKLTGYQLDEDIQKEIIGLRARFSQCKKAARKGLLTNEEKRVEEQKIVSALTDVVYIIKTIGILKQKS